MISQSSEAHSTLSVDLSSFTRGKSEGGFKKKKKKKKKNEKFEQPKNLAVIEFFKSSSAEH